MKEADLVGAEDKEKNITNENPEWRKFSHNITKKNSDQQFEEIHHYTKQVG